MRIRAFLILTFLLFVLTAPAFSEGYSFPGILAEVQLPEGVYEVVLTPDNLQANQSFIQSKGSTVEKMSIAFKSQGILIQAYDQEEDRVLVITALEDVDAKRYFDINALTPDERSKYRLSHGSGGAYTVLGYKYDSVSWKNFDKVGRFLQLRYIFRQEGELVCRGFQRRTIRNGYTMTIDLQVYGRALTAGDNNALNKVFNKLSFSQILPVPELPIFMDETATAPIETNKASFTLKGKTKSSAKLSAVLMSFDSNKGQVFETVAAKNGNYSLPIEMPADGIYLMTVTIESPGLEPFTKAYNINYQKGLLPVLMTAEPPAEFLQDSFKLTGKTEAGTTAILLVNGVETTKRVGNNGTFSFTLDTSKEGSYNILLTLSKKGFDNRSFVFASSRFLSQDAMNSSLKDSAMIVSYSDLASNPGAYDGKLLTYEGYITSIEEKAGEWIIRFALRKTDTGFADLLIIASEYNPGFALNTPVRFYGEMVGINSQVNEAGEEIAQPKFQLKLMEGLPQ